MISDKFRFDIHIEIARLEDTVQELKEFLLRHPVAECVPIELPQELEANDGI